MQIPAESVSRRLSLYLSLAVLISIISAAAALVSCSGSTSLKVINGMATVHVSITDPPSCEYPNGSFQHVYVTIRSVQANISSTAGDGDPGWVELAPQLNSSPMQIDLFAAGPNACLLAMLGTNSALPAGTYQQIRLLLVANDGGSGPIPSTNACGTRGFNCVVLHDGSIDELQLSSQANTGLKIPPGQVLGGPITVNAGQDVDINIDFNSCASIIQEGNGQFRLKPVLTAGQVGTTDTGIDGQIVDATTRAPIAGTVIVALEQQDGNGDDVIFVQAAADAMGNFNFCPLPVGTTFDVVAVAINGAGVAYNASIALNVPGGTNLGTIPLVPEKGNPSGAATIQGFVTATTGTAPSTIDVAVSAMQAVALSGGMTRSVSIPAEGQSTNNIAVSSNTNCPISAPLHANCAQYTLNEPASNPSVGAFSAGKISYAPPASGDVLYSVGAEAFAPMQGGVTSCKPPAMSTSLDSTGNPLKAAAGATVTAKEIDFSGCS